MPHGDGYDPVGLQHPSVHYDEDAQRPSQSREASYSTAAHSANNMSYPPRRVQLADEHGATSPAAPYPFASGAGPSSSTGDNPYFTEKRMPEPTHHSMSRVCNVQQLFEHEHVLQAAVLRAPSSLQSRSSRATSGISIHEMQAKPIYNLRKVICPRTRYAC